MPYRGLPPKDESERVNRVPKRFEKTVIEADDPEDGPIIRGIDLPDTAPGGVEWCERTLEWWYVWRTSPQAKLMGNTDWEFMLECAVLHNEIWRSQKTFANGTIKTHSANSLTIMMAELRQRVAKFGATWEDRAKLQLQIQIPQTEDEANKRVEREAKAAVNYAERLLQKATEVTDGTDNPNR